MAVVVGPAKEVRAPVAEELVVPRPVAPDPAPALRALWFAGALVAAALVLGGVAALRGRGRERPTPVVGSPLRGGGAAPPSRRDKPTDAGR